MREVGSDGDMAAPCLREREHEGERELLISVGGKTPACYRGYREVKSVKVMEARKY